MEQSAFDNLTLGWIALGIIVFPLTLFITAPFGRHYSSRFGPAVNNRLGWILIESPAIWWFTLVFVMGATSKNQVAWVLWALWMFHYVNRGIVFPFRLRTRGKKIPLMIVGFGIGFQAINGFFNGMALGKFGSQYSNEWLALPNFWIGLSLFLTGWFINIRSDDVLLNLRKPDETDYRIPEGGLFNWISCPNFLGEMILWSGWAVMCWNLAAFSFALWTIANLVPRALAHHRWYQKNFESYPAKRKAIFPGVL